MAAVIAVRLSRCWVQISQIFDPSKVPQVLGVTRVWRPDVSLERGRPFSGQPLLPMLPVPPLQDTLQKYLRTVKPLVSPDEFQQTSELVQKFGAPGGQGEKLQRMLEDRARNKDNWLADWWLETAYLDCRTPLLVYSSPGLIFPLQTFNTKEQQLKFASKVISGALDYKIMLDEKCVPQEMMGKDPLDMSQYFKVLGTCRIPGIPSDSIAFHGSDQLSPPRHIVVAHNNWFFKVDVYGSRGEVLNESQILGQLENIISRSTRPHAPVGLLTTDNRNSWAKAYRTLAKDKSNKQSLRAIASGIFLVCLDGPNVDLGAPNKQTVAALQMIHGGGSKGNAANRWYDKTIQFVVGMDGELGLTYEHSPAEGPPIATLMDHIMDYIEQRKGKPRLPAVKFPRPERLMFTVEPEIEKAMELAAERLDVMVEDLEMTCFTFPTFGKDFIKRHQLSPDSFIQMALQLAFYRIHGVPGAHYESASTRKYIHGRTETIRSCSVESLNFCQAMLKPELSDDVKLETLKSAIDGHRKYAMAAVNGYGVDRHLLGLKMMAIEQGIDVPRLFLDYGYTHSSHMRISSSQVPARCDAFMCYGPLVPDGYGACYNPRKSEINFGLSACNSHPETSSAQFRQALEDSLVNMHDLLLKTQKAKL